MGYDRIRFYNGNTIHGTTITADKSSAETIYGRKFMSFISCLGYEVRQVVDPVAVSRSIDLQNIVNRGQAKIGSLPVALQASLDPAVRVVEIAPPLSKHHEESVLAYLKSHCEPNDAAMVIDCRNQQETVLCCF